jgi:hypothetical protein
MAPKSSIVSQYFSDILVNTPYYITDYGMVITNNSYASAADNCPGEGEYDALSNFVDAQTITYPSMLHVFAAGNDGGNVCSPYSGGFATIKSGFQCAKNILSVGAINSSDYLVAGFSSRGPVNDGRLKPEIVAGGVNVMSTEIDNFYGSGSGTSLSSPAVAGTMALLYERYRQLHGGVNPAAALIKAVTCNSADDLGNPGPDYTYGFGMLNARNAVEALEDNRYFTGTVSNGGSATFSVTGVPAGTKQIKVLLYWPDAPAAANASTALVNNLDLTVTAPDVPHRPLILNPNFVNVNNNAVEGVDALNNIEQVVINDPPAGDFTITVNGTVVPSGTQSYVVTYQVLPPSVTVEYPFGKETWVPGETENIRWSAYDKDVVNTFTIEYSTNNGSTWSLISNNVPATSRSYAWTVPATPTSTALIRVTRNTSGYSDVSDDNFTVIGQPVVTLGNPCRTFLDVNWTAITGATSYEVLLLKGDSLERIATTTGTTYTISGLPPTPTYNYVAVQAVIGGTPGRHSIGVRQTADNGPCASPTYDNDLTADKITAPVSGRQFTSSQMGSANIAVRLINSGQVATAGPFNISYSVNGAPAVTEAVAASVPAGGTYTYTFTASYDFSPTGAYDIKAWINYPGDPSAANDTTTIVIKHLQNNPLTLSPSFTEGFESAAAQSYVLNPVVPLTGLAGLDRADFSTNNSNGRVRTFVNTGIARSGNRAITLDQNNYLGITSTNNLITTFNLSSYTPTDHIWLDFYFRNHGIDFTLPGNQVWIRGNDMAAWIPVYTLPVTYDDIGYYKASPHVNVTDILAAAVPAQTISSSFQVRFGEQGYTPVASVINDTTYDDGFTFDDVKITNAQNDVGVTALAAPATTAICNLSNTEPITVSVKNYTNVTVNNVAVSYNVNGTIVTENIPTINGGQTVNYTFVQTANLSAYQVHDVSVWINYPTDTYSNNDSLMHTRFRTTPVITSYPYLEGFETNNGYWYSGGINSSWEWGTPNKSIINKAANGTKAWVTSVAAGYKDNELSYLYSPCFNLTGLTQPVLSFSHIFKTEDDCPCDYHWMEYTLDDITWTKLGASGNGVNWYDDASQQAWQQNGTKWRVSSYDLPMIGAPKVRFRMVMSADPFVHFDGVGIDDVTLFDKAAIYSGANISNGITQNVSGSNWVNFDMGGNRVVAINPNGQNLGNTTVKVFINTGAVRTSNNQYYLDRNIVVQPTNAPSANVGVRFYFLESEAVRLMNATGCGTCTTIGDAYEAGVTQYSNAPAEEDSVLANNSTGNYFFHVPQLNVHVIPYDNGYYAEYQVGNFSEFWINGGGPGRDQSLPLRLLSFTVTKENSRALLKWSTTTEINTDKFIIEKSNDGIHYTVIGTVTAARNTINNYQFTDNALSKGVNFYRLKMKDADGHFQYSPVRTVLYGGSDVAVQVYPNPVTKGVLYINSAVNCSRIELSDASGKVIRAINVQGLQNQLPVTGITAGVYFVTVITDAGKKIEKVIVE